MISDGSVKAGTETVGRQVVWLLEGPVPACEGTSQHQLSEGLHEEDAPEDAEEVDELEDLGEC